MIMFTDKNTFNSSLFDDSICRIEYNSDYSYAEGHAYFLFLYGKKCNGKDMFAQDVVVYDKDNYKMKDFIFVIKEIWPNELHKNNPETHSMMLGCSMKLSRNLRTEADPIFELAEKIKKDTIVGKYEILENKLSKFYSHRLLLFL